MKWKFFRSTNRLNTRGSHENIREFFRKEGEIFTRAELRAVVASAPHDEPRFARHLASYALDVAAANSDYATLQVVLENFPIQHVWGQRLDYFLASRTDKTLFYTLFSAYKVALDSGKKEIADSLKEIVECALPRAGLGKLTKPNDFLIEARSYYGSISSGLHLDPEATQINLSFKEMEFGLLDFARKQEEIDQLIRERYLPHDHSALLHRGP